MEEIEIHVGTVINQTELERTIEKILKDYIHQTPEIQNNTQDQVVSYAQ